MTTPVDIVLRQVDLPFEGRLHDFQIDDINRLALYDNCGLWLDLGLGKTVVSTLIACYKLIEEDYNIVYVLCPAVLVTQWAETLSKMDLTVTAYAGTPAQRKKLNRRVNFLVMSYEIFQKDYDLLKRANAFFIIDECTILCNTQNILYKMLQGGTVTKKKRISKKLLPEITERRFKKINKGCCLLSATPINKPPDAYGLIKILTPEAYRNYSQFLRVHVLKFDYFGNPEEYFALGMLKENLLIAATQRSTQDHIKLPEIIFKTVKYDLDKKHQKLYDKLMDERFITVDGEVLIDAIEATSLYNWAQKLVFNPEEGGYEKDPAGLELLDGLVNSVEQYISFGNYRMTNGKLRERYGAGASYGDIGSKKKQEFILAFKGGSLKGLICHPKSGGFGLDLPMCQQAFFPELPITPRDFFQCIGRMHRQGQKKTVVVTTLVARNTIQETLFRRIMEKGDLMKQVFDTPRSLREDLQAEVIFTGKKTKEQVIKELKGEIM